MNESISTSLIKLCASLLQLTGEKKFMDHFLATRPSFNKIFIVYFVRIRLICMCTVSTMYETWMLDVNCLEPKLSVATSVVEQCYAVVRWWNKLHISVDLWMATTNYDQGHPFLFPAPTCPSFSSSTVITNSVRCRQLLGMMYKD